MLYILIGIPIIVAWYLIGYPGIVLETNARDRYFQALFAHRTEPNRKGWKYWLRPFIGDLNNNRDTRIGNAIFSGIFAMLGPAAFVTTFVISVTDHPAHLFKSIKYNMLGFKERK